MRGSRYSNILILLTEDFLWALTNKQQYFLQDFSRLHYLCQKNECIQNILPIPLVL